MNISGPPSRQAVRAESVECEECKSKDSLVGGSCQICGHESLLHSLTARRAPLLHSYSYSCSGRSQSSYSSVRSSPAGEHCPDCKSHGSIHMGACQVCGFSFDARQKQELKAQWVPYSEVKEQQDPLNFAFSQLKIRCGCVQMLMHVARLLDANAYTRKIAVILIFNLVLCLHNDTSHALQRRQRTDARRGVAALADARNQA